IHDSLSSGLTIDRLDPRLQHLLQQLDGCLEGNCLTPEHWLAAEVSANLALSESRFLHLFRQQMGIAWRPYLLWRRLLCAVQQMAHGLSATAAAHQAGFADSAHLSRTFRSTFGMTIRQASRLFRASAHR
ncbi:MAG: AraC family transcriptional regulator, partial [Pseudomonadota bacterium]